jgi:hypothetical protein
VSARVLPDGADCAARGWHDDSVAVCDCGRAWTHAVVEDGVPTCYCDEVCVHRFHALYGPPSTFRYLPVSELPGDAP